MENIQNLLLKNCLPQMLEIRYVALPSGPILSFSKPRSEGPKIALRQGLLSLKNRNTYENTKKIFCFRTTGLRMMKFGIEDFIVGLCSKGGPRIPKSSAELGFGFELLNPGERFGDILALLLNMRKI